MIDALLTGTIHAAPQQRTGASGKPFTVCRVRVPARDGTSLFVSAIAFADEAQAALSALSAGDAVALAGEFSPGAWLDKEGTARPSADLLVHKVLMPYHVTRKRAAMAKPASAPDKAAAWKAGAPDDGWLTCTTPRGG